MTDTITQQLAGHFATVRYEDFPQDKIAAVKQLVQDYMGVAIAGSQTASGKIAGEFAVVTGGNAQATLIGSGKKVPAVHAGFANAISSHSIELDDVDILALFHFSPPIVSAALATAEMVNANGKDFITAVAAGCDIMARLSNAINPSLRNRGFHTTPTCGVFGAAVAAGKLLGLDKDQMTSALGMAGAQASGLMEMYGTSMQKRFNPGPAARNGVTAAVLAKMGFTGAETIIEGERGFCRGFSDQFVADKLTENLGKDVPVYIEFKPYSCARPIHNAIDCALNIRRANNPDLAQIAKITVYRHPDWAHYHIIPNPRTYHEAQVSLPYSVAVAFKEGAALFQQYANEKLTDPTIVRLSRMVEIIPDASLPRGVSCNMIVEMADGTKYASQVDYPKGSIENPMNETEFSNKTHMLADGLIGKEKTDSIIAKVRQIESLPQVGDLMKLAVC